MAIKLKPNRGAQYALHSEFTFNMTDTMVDITGAENVLGIVGTKVYEIGNLPGNATLLSGSLTVDVVSNDGGVSTVAVGDSATAARYLAATSVKALAFTPLVATGYRGVGENLRMTVVNGVGGATTGTVTVRFAYVIRGRTNEVQTV